LLIIACPEEWPGGGGDPNALGRGWNPVIILEYLSGGRLITREREGFEMGCVLL
jgi:hypothetical protein